MPDRALWLPILLAIMDVCGLAAFVWMRRARRKRGDAIPKPDTSGGYPQCHDYAHWMAWRERVAEMNRLIAQPMGRTMKPVIFEPPLNTVGVGQYTIHILGSGTMKTFSEGHYDTLPPSARYGIGYYTGTIFPPYDPKIGEENLSMALAYLLSEVCD